MFNIKKYAQNELADIDRVIDKADDSLDSQGAPTRSNPKSPEEILKTLTPEQKAIAKNNLVYQSWLRIQDSIKKMPHGSKVIGYLNGMPEYKDLSVRYKNLTTNQTSDKLVDGKTIDELANMGFSTLLTNNLQAQESAILSRAKSIQKKLEQQDIIRSQKRLQQFSRAAFNLNQVKKAQIQPYLENLDSKSTFIKKYLPLLLSNDINKFNSARNEILSSVGLGTAMVDEVRTLLESIQQLTPERIQEAEEILDNIYTNWMSPNSKTETQEGLVMSQNNPKGIIKYDLSDRVLNNKPLNKEAAANIGAESLLYGPTEKRICPKLRGKGGGVPGSGDVVSEYVCRHHCLDGIVIDDNKTVCGEALWRANVMDKFSREYVNEDGDIVGGYLNKRFEINRNVPEENKMRLKPGETRKPRPPEMGNMEARMQAMREKEGEKRGYRPTTDVSSPFNWCKDVDQNNVNVSQSEKNKREENSGHELINSEKKSFNFSNLTKNAQYHGPIGIDNPSSDDLGLSEDMHEPLESNVNFDNVFEVGLEPGEYNVFISNPNIEKFLLNKANQELGQGFSISSIDDKKIVFQYNGPKPPQHSEQVLEMIVQEVFSTNTVKAKTTKGLFNYAPLKNAGHIEEIKELNNELSQLELPEEPNEDDLTTLENISNKVVPRQVAAFNLKNIKTAQGDNVPGTDNGLDFAPSESPIRDNEFDHDFVQCPICDGEGQLLGQLGKTKHYRCRNCGIVFNNSDSKMASFANPKKKR